MKEDKYKQIVLTMDKSKKARDKVFEAIYGESTKEMHKDWSKDSYEEKYKFIKKYFGKMQLNKEWERFTEFTAGLKVYGFRNWKKVAKEIKEKEENEKKLY